MWLCKVARADVQDANKKVFPGALICFPGFSAQSTDSLIFAPLSLHWRVNLLLTNMAELNRHVKTGGSLACGDHALVEFTILRDMGQVKCRVRTLNFRKATFS